MLFGRVNAFRMMLMAFCLTTLSLLSVPADARNAEHNMLDWLSDLAASQQLAQHFCNNVYNPVCGTIAGHRRTYSNRCRARRAGAIRIRPGRCRAAVCSNVYRPVCGFRLGRRTTYRNACWARRAGANSIRAGRCVASIRTCHQRSTTRRYAHRAGRSWNPACRVAPIRTCHRRGTSRRYPHIRNRSWNTACRVSPAPRARRAGDPCVGKDSQGIPFNGRLVVDQRGGLNCIAGGGAR